MKIEVKDQKYLFNGEERFLISGEFHYFRVPQKDWETRLIQFKEMYGNCLATYVPWCVHEMTEGDICFGDEPQRDLAAFLELCKKHDMPVILRPGPYVYSELINGGIPNWMVEKYPEALACRINGTRIDSFSYMHPTFLEKARPYYKAFADVARPYLECNGGTVCMIQLDNELTGTHIWAGTLDYNPETWGFGKEDGRYAKLLLNRYGSLEKINEEYGTSWRSLCEARPMEKNGNDIHACKNGNDMFEFYLDLCGEYLETLAAWLKEDGIEAPLCHNAGNENMTGYFEHMLPRLEKFGGMLLGCDHYYCLSQNSDFNNPTPHYAINMLRSHDQMRHLGMPPTVMEMPGGSLASFPPILAEDLLACYMVNTAFGMKGLNYYIYTGGPNFRNTGSTGDVYDFGALIRADGSVNKTYYAAQKFGKFLDEHRWLQSAKREVSVRVACEQELYRCKTYEYNTEVSQENVRTMIKKGMNYTLLASEYAPEFCDTAMGVPSTDKPLILCGGTTLSEQSQKNIIEFLKNGGKLLVMTLLPTLNERYEPCTVLKDFIGITEEPFSIRRPLDSELLNEGVYDASYKRAFILQENDTVLGTTDGKPVIIKRNVANGEVIYAAYSYMLMHQSHVDVVRGMLKNLGAEPTVEHSNRQIFTTLLKHEDGRGIIFVMNLYSSSQSTDIKVGDKVWENVELKPMEVLTLEF